MLVAVVNIGLICTVLSVCTHMLLDMGVNLLTLAIWKSLLSTWHFFKFRKFGVNISARRPAVLTDVLLVVIGSRTAYYSNFTMIYFFFPLIYTSLNTLTSYEIRLWTDY